jgi:hypothetical protein
VESPDQATDYSRRVRALEAFGHRGSCTPNERAAAEYLVAELRAAGIEAGVEPFHGARCGGERLLVHVALAALGAVVLPRLPAVAGGLTVLALFSLFAEQMTRGVWLSWPATRSQSQNVVGRVPAAAATAARRIVLCAHYDTQPSGWIWALNRYLMPLGVRSPLWLMPPFTPVVFMMVAELGVAVAALVASRLAPVARIAAALLLLGYAVLAVVLLQWSFGRPVPGAADNASGVAAVLAIAESWLTGPRPAVDVELVVLLSGCEECGLLGTAAWADRHRAELRALPTVFLNVDGIGFGPPRFLGAEVPAGGVPLSVPSWVLKECAAVALEQGLIDAGPHALPGPTDGLAFLARGVPGVSVVGFRDGFVLPHYHTMRDTSENMDFAAAQAGTRFAQAILRRLAAHTDVSHRVRRSADTRAFWHIPNIQLTSFLTFVCCDPKLECRPSQPESESSVPHVPPTRELRR